MPKNISPAIENLRKQVDELESLSAKPERLEGILLEASTSLMAILESINHEHTKNASLQEADTDLDNASHNLLEVLNHSQQKLVESEARS
ncbi:MAG: hypothetical protein KAI94_00365, partial [Anaerolineales bacterium]|nr:hypothetical protein [Anaerolineales bacterium]